jgi:hypothetical protein
LEKRQNLTFVDKGAKESVISELTHSMSWRSENTWVLRAGLQPKCCVCVWGGVSGADSWGAHNPLAEAEVHICRTEVRGLHHIQVRILLLLLEPGRSAFLSEEWR